MKDKLFHAIMLTCAILMPLICGGMVLSLATDAYEAFNHFGFLNFLTSSEWDYNGANEQYGALPFITGAVITTILALVICVPFSLPVSLFIGEYFRGTRVACILNTVLELLAAIPSIIYELWGFHMLEPVIMSFNMSPENTCVLTAAIVLAIMIIPYASSLSSEFIKMVPADLKESAYSLGATRADIIRRIIFPIAGSGIFSSYVLAIGRALGETMTVTILIGNTSKIPETSTSNSMASILANQFGDAEGLRLSSLIAIGLILFLITAAINLAGKMMIKHARIS